METVIGIDLGTTNSEVCLIRQGSPVVLEEDGARLIPSFVGISPEGKLLVGQEARNQYLLYPERTVKSIKRKMGSEEKVSLDGKEFTPQEISAFILKKLKTRAEAELGAPATKAVITVPAYFSDAQRQATRDAGELAGLEVLRIINEPTAAALAYTSGDSKRQKVLVYDLGGGTFDVSVVRIEQGVVEVLASHGNNHLGGDDFDAKIMEWLQERIKEEYGLDVADNVKARARLWRAAEAAKRTLSDEPFARIEEEYLGEKNGVPVNVRLELERSDYEEMIRPFVDETLKAIQTALDGAGLSSREIDRILLVGGSSRTPLVAATIRETYGLEPHAEVDPDLCVALGAGIQAGMLAGEEVGAVLVDITPYTFGTCALGMLNGEYRPNVYAPLIHRNSALPTAKSEVFMTVMDRQKAVEVNVYQGEDPDALNNIRIGTFHIEGLSAVPAGNEIILRFELNVDGILKVTALEKKTGLQKHITIDNALTHFEHDEMDAAKSRIQDLWGKEEGEDFDSEAEAEERHEIVRAKAVVLKARSMLENIPEDDAEEVIELIENIEAGLEESALDEVETAVDRLSDILFYLE